VTYLILPEWALIPVYGAAQDAQKAAFLAELVRFCEDDSLPMLVGGILILFVGKMKRIMTISMPASLSCLMPS
jgi:hypothetical protein